MSTDINMHQQTPTNINRNLKQHLSVTLGRSVGLLEYLSIFCGCLRFSDVFGSYPSTSPLHNEAKTLFWGRPEIKDFFACSVWNIKISQNIKMSRYQLSKTPWVMSNLCFFLCPSEENHKTQSVGSPCISSKRSSLCTRTIISTVLWSNNFAQDHKILLQKLCIFINIPQS